MHLRVTDVLYKKKQSEEEELSEEVVEQNEDVDEPDENYDDCLQFVDNDCEIEFSEDIFPVMKKVRAVVKSFRKSLTLCKLQRNLKMSKGQSS